MSAAVSLGVTPIGEREIGAAREYSSLHAVERRLGLADPRALSAAIIGASAGRRALWQWRLSLIENGATFDRAGGRSAMCRARAAGRRQRAARRACRPPFRPCIQCRVHPVTLCPTSHANVRLFTARGGEVGWFGGGSISPVYPFDRTRVPASGSAGPCEPAARRLSVLKKPAIAISSCRIAVRRGSGRVVRGLT